MSWRRPATRIEEQSFRERCAVWHMLWCNIPSCGPSQWIGEGLNRRSESRALDAGTARFRACESGRRAWWGAGNPNSPRGFSRVGHLFAPAGNKQVTPKLKVQKPPDTIGGVFASGTMGCDERVHLAKIEVSCQQSIGRAQGGIERLGPWIAQPSIERRGKSHLLAVDDAAGKQITHSGFENVLLSASPNLQPVGDASCELHERVVEKGDAALDRS